MEALVRRVAMTGMFMLAGSAGGAIVASADYLLACAMGAFAGLAAALIVLHFPRDRDYPNNNFWAD
jgi:hypothetical protein